MVPAGGRQPPRWYPPLYMYICIYLYMYICIYLYMYVHMKNIYVYIYIYLDTYVSPPAYIHTYVRTYISLHYITLHHITLHYIALHYITLHTYMPIPTNLRRYIHTTPNPPHRGGGEAEVPCMIVGFQGGSTPNPRNHPHRIHTYIPTYLRTYIHTCLYLPTYVGTYILHPTHPTGGGGEAEVPCMIVGFQGGSTPNPRNHPHRGGGEGGLQACTIYIHIYIHIYIYGYICIYIYNVGCLIVITPPIFFLKGGGQPSYNNFWESIAGIMICI